MPGTRRSWCSVNNITTIAASKNTRAVLLNDQWRSLSQTFTGTVNGDALLTQSTAASVAAIPFAATEATPVSTKE